MLYLFLLQFKTKTTYLVCATTLIYKKRNLYWTIRNAMSFSHILCMWMDEASLNYIEDEKSAELPLQVWFLRNFHVSDRYGNVILQ